VISGKSGNENTVVQYLHRALPGVLHRRFELADFIRVAMPHWSTACFMSISSASAEAMKHTPSPSDQGHTPSSLREEKGGLTSRARRVPVGALLRQAGDDLGMRPCVTMDRT